MLLSKNKEKENKKKGDHKERKIKVTLDESASEQLKEALKEFKGDFAKINLSQLASEAVSYFFQYDFAKEKVFIKKRYFDAQSFFKGKRNELRTAEDIENILKDVLAMKKSNRGRRKKEDKQENLT